MGFITGAFKKNKTDLIYNNEVFRFPLEEERDIAYEEFMKCDRNRNLFGVVRVRNKYSDYIIETPY